MRLLKVSKSLVLVLGNVAPVSVVDKVEIVPVFLMGMLEVVALAVERMPEVVSMPEVLMAQAQVDPVVDVLLALAVALRHLASAYHLHPLDLLRCLVGPFQVNFANVCLVVLVVVQLLLVVVVQPVLVLVLVPVLLLLLVRVLQAVTLLRLHLALMLMLLLPVLHSLISAPMTPSFPRHHRWVTFTVYRTRRLLHLPKRCLWMGGCRLQ